jgi:small subunit ribosomal protein S1
MEQNNDSFESLFSQSEEKTLRKLSPGEKIKATVVGIDKETVFLDVGTKSEGIIEASEFNDEHGELSIAVGDQVEVYCLKSGPGGQIFTARLGSGASSAHLEEAYRSSVPVEGFVKAEIKGGFEITLSGNVRGFCPYSQMGLRRVENGAEAYLETHMSFLITKFEAGGRNIVLSARLLQEEERRLRKEELQEVLEEGHTIEIHRDDGSVAFFLVSSSVLVDKDEYLAHLCRYIHLNPVKAGFVQKRRRNGTARP